MGVEGRRHHIDCRLKVCDENFLHVATAFARSRAIGVSHDFLHEHRLAAGVLRQSLEPVPKGVIVGLVSKLLLQAVEFLPDQHGLSFG